MWPLCECLQETRAGTPSGSGSGSSSHLLHRVRGSQISTPRNPGPTEITSDCIPVPTNKTSSLAETAERGKRIVEDTGVKQQSLHRDSELPKWQAKQNILEGVTSAALWAIRPHKQDREKPFMRWLYGGEGNYPEPLLSSPPWAVGAARTPAQPCGGPHPLTHTHNIHRGSAITIQAGGWR